MKQVTRRDFFKTSAVAAAMATAIPVVAASKPVWAQAPSDRLRLGCIGLGQMGRGDAGEFNRLTDIVAICDVDEQYGIANALRMNLGKRDAKGKVVKPDAYKDYRRILERNDIDVVCIATPDHWHVKIAVEARLLSETADAHAGRKPDYSPRLREVSKDVPDRHVAALSEKSVCIGDSAGSQGIPRRNQKDNLRPSRLSHVRRHPQEGRSRFSGLGNVARSRAALRFPG